MKKILFAFTFLLQVSFVKAQNTFPTTGNVGIGTPTPSSLLEVNGLSKSKQVEIASGQSDGVNFTDATDRENKSRIFSINSGSGTPSNRKLFEFYDVPQSNLNSISYFYSQMRDRADKRRYFFRAFTSGETNFTVFNKNENEFFKVYEDGNDNVFLQMGKPNSRVIIGAWGTDPKAGSNKLFVGTGNARIDGNLVVDSKVGIGVTDPKFKLDIEGGGANGQTFASTTERGSKTLILNAGTVVDATTGRRMLTFCDFPQSNLDNIAMSYFAIEDRNDSNRFRHWAKTGSGSQLELNDKDQKPVLSVYEDATNVFFNMPKPDSYLSIGGKPVWPIPHRFWVLTGTSKFNNDVFVDTHIGIGTDKFIDALDNNKEYKLSVKGRIRAEEVKVYNTWADYVFAKDYTLKPLSEVESFIKENNHLPNVPSAKEVTEKGLELGEMAKIQQEKIEELTLYLIQQNKEIQELKAQVKALLEAKQK